jgi:uncharacterized protein (TIGR02099 family)
MKRLLRAVEILAWGVFFVLAALVLVVRFWVLPDIERFREPIVAAMSHAIGRPVRVGAIEAGWLGLRPEIRLLDVRIHDAQGREALVLPSIDNVIAWRSLLHGELRLHRLAIDGPRLGVRRDAAGELYVAGLKVPRGESSGGNRGLGVLSGHGEIVIRNAEIEWRDELRGAPPLVLSGLELRLAQSGRSLALGLSARPPAELGSTIDLRVMVDPRTLEAKTFTGRVFLQLGYTDLAAWRPWMDYPFDVRAGQGAVRMWATMQDGRVMESTTDVALANVRALLGDELSPLELVSVSGRVHARELADGVELSGRGLELVMERGPEMPKTDFRIVYRPQAGGELGASVVDLEAVRHLVEALPLPPQIAGHLDELAPRGRLADARLEWTGPFDAPARFSARVKFSGLAMRARDQVPGFSGLSGSIEATHEKGRLELESRHANLDLPRLFPQGAIALDSLAGRIEWQREGAQGVTVRLASLTFANANASGTASGSYAWHGEGPGSVDLSVLFNRADGASVPRYLPQTLPAAARKWLASAVLAGQVTEARVRVRGDLRDFPFTDPAKGEFQVSARVEKGVLAYAPGWPRVEDIVAELTFDRERVEVVGRSGTILGARLANVRVTIPKLAGDALIQLSGQADGESAEFLQFVAASPLREKAAFATEMKAAGRGKLRVKLELPLADLDKTRVEGEYDFGGNEVSVLPWLPPVAQAEGRLVFTDSSFTLQKVRGQFLGGTVTVVGGTRAGRGTGIVARGDATVEAARQVPMFDYPQARELSGTFNYVMTLQAKDGPPRITLESPLRGVESKLPPPLAKQPAETLPLRVEIIPTSGQRDRIAVTLGTIARAELSRRKRGEDMEVQRTAVWLTPERDQPIRLPERPGMLVYGSLAAFDLDRWRPFLVGKEQPGDGPAQPISLELRLGTLDALGKRFNNVALRASAASSAWSANVTADEMAGDVSYREDKGTQVLARLSRFIVPADTPGAGAREAGRPGEMPQLDFVADEFTFRGWQLGRVEVVAQPQGEDWRIASATMVTADASLNGSGLWGATPSRTAFNFDLQVSDIGSFLARVGHPGMLKGGSAAVQGSLTWQGDPGSLDFPSLGGELQMQAESGQFLEIEPGLGKLIGLMSLQSLPKRITLDFRDVFSKGFQFDRINTAAQLERGVARLKDFRMRGSAADVEMRGDIDLARETQDLRVRVVPSLALGDSAAIGIGIVNPVAGIAAAIAQRLLRNPLGQIFSFDYSVTGSWADPKVAKIQAPTPQATTGEQ